MQSNSINLLFFCLYDYNLSLNSIYKLKTNPSTKFIASSIPNIDPFSCWWLCREEEKRKRNSIWFDLTASVRLKNSSIDFQWNNLHGRILHYYYYYEKPTVTRTHTYKKCCWIIVQTNNRCLSFFVLHYIPLRLSIQFSVRIHAHMQK